MFEVLLVLFCLVRLGAAIVAGFLSKGSGGAEGRD